MISGDSSLVYLHLVFLTCLLFHLLLWVWLLRNYSYVAFFMDFHSLLPDICGLHPATPVPEVCSLHAAPWAHPTRLPLPFLIILQSRTPVFLLSAYSVFLQPLRLSWDLILLVMSLSVFTNTTLCYDAYWVLFLRSYGFLVVSYGSLISQLSCQLLKLKNMLNIPHCG